MKPRRLRILWSSNSPWGTSGYATQTALIVPRLKAAGFPIAVNSFAGLNAGILGVGEWEFKGSRWEGIPFYPTLNHIFGSDGLWYNGNKFNADIAIPFQDIPTLHPDDLKRVKRLVPYIPIDREPTPPLVLQNLNYAWRIITYSQFGQETLAKSGYASEMIPHGVDLEIFKPLDKAACKQAFGLSPETFVMGMIAANKENPPRKGFQHVLDAFKRFLGAHPNSVLWFHVNVNQPGGFPIVNYANFLGIGSQIRFIDPYDMGYMAGADMNKLMNAFDCLVAPSFSEGFGLPVAEAQAAGVPVIVNNFSSQPELVIPGKTGFIAASDFKRFDMQHAYISEVDLDSLYTCMEQVYAADRQAMGVAARQHILDNYNIDRLVAERWIPYLERLELEIYGAPVEEVTPDPMMKALEQTKDQFGEGAVKILG